MTVQDDGDELDIEQVLKDILVPLLEERDKQLKAHLDNVVIERLKKAAPEPVQDAEEGNSRLSPEVKALQARIKAMEQKAADDAAAQERAKLDNYLTDVVSGFKTDEPKLAKLALKDVLGEIVNTDGAYLTKDGKPVTDVAKEFFSSSTGQRLLPATMRNGSGVPKGNPQRATGNPELTTDDVISKVFGGF